MDSVRHLYHIHLLFLILKILCEDFAQVLWARSMHNLFWLGDCIE